ncbi:hypothetical protein KMW28_12250 [Flammeovirga yaeyamensis]|uniref:Uncharacterized protein n=1 Tax=Flammeovirga yaeyamensis TaxID=367791 RepID=A0AAX1N2N1_9BACT|nr:MULTISPECIES: hypothetical protein [Flammeovirga]ANQ48143.1 hypothetical protein MY04_0761 [Flammeovirga sp. MY04]MBB3696062.1 hypothetical protein [Flammeovirga yaeyamensis]NMF34747.1 hypothetical protein [Flammeovirga yaeyamensis]QWG00425.1 hypothetical protein KMW28_12250 [Flammeovirga yaeyamensis]
MTTELVDLLKMTLPAGIVLVSAFYIVKMFLQKEYDVLSIKMKTDQQEQTLPLKLQAYERLALFLERISYRELLDRTNYEELDAITTQQVLIMTIKEEFNHNLSQQIYISPDLWEMVRGAKEQSISFINSTAKALNKDAHGVELAKAILEQSIAEEMSPTDLALNELKKEVQVLF